ncbi:unnamed protein product [Mytilus coruscus]|uniref:Uncharacterized protein n=1 Tax=Mytilus coruscus TaxID=42192 RepID=A0A6J8CRT5_MYTCO|nr:unnamed protein product [Mytilus coruscus]
MQRRYQIGQGTQLQASLCGQGTYPLEIEGDENDLALKEVYEANAPLLLENHREGSFYSVYNIPLTNDVDMHQLMLTADTIYQRQQYAYKSTMTFGVILIHTEEKRYRFFKPYENYSVFNKPLFSSKRDDLDQLRRKLTDSNLREHLMKQRPNTKWKPYLVANVLCAFRCLALHRAQQTIFEKLEECDIKVPPKDQTFPWFIVFDSEAILQRVHGSTSSKLVYTTKHVPISVSLCSNVPGHIIPMCFVGTNLDTLLNSMFNPMFEIYETVIELSEIKWGLAKQELNKTKQRWSEEGDFNNDEDECKSIDGDDDENQPPDGDQIILNGNKIIENQLIFLNGQLEGYMTQFKYKDLIRENTI